VADGYVVLFNRVYCIPKCMPYLNQGIQLKNGIRRVYSLGLWYTETYYRLIRNVAYAYYHSGVLGPIVASIMRLFQSCVRPIVRHFSFCLKILLAAVF